MSPDWLLSGMLRRRKRNGSAFKEAGFPARTSLIFLLMRSPFFIWIGYLYFIGLYVVGE
jgi:hypothetical protein